MIQNGSQVASQQLAAMGPVSDDEKIFGALMMCVPANVMVCETRERFYRVSSFDLEAWCAYGQPRQFFTFRLW